MAEAMEHFDVVIAGAGISGLAAAYMLKNNFADLRLVVVEAGGSIGGRLCREQLKGPGDKVANFDLGGHWISRTQPHVSSLAKEFGLEVTWQDSKGLMLMVVGDGAPVQYENQQNAGMSLLTALDLLMVTRKLSLYYSIVADGLGASQTRTVGKEAIMQNIGNKKIQKCQDQISPYITKTSLVAKEYDSQTLDTFKQQNMMTKDGKAAFDLVTRTFLGADPMQMSLLYFVNYCCQGGNLSQLIDSNQPGNAQEQYLKEGAFQFVEELADRIGRDNIKLNAFVTSVSQTKDKVQVRLENGVEFTANHVLLSMPVHMKARIQYSPPLPSDQAALFERLPMGNMIKFYATYESRFWKERGLSGEAAYCSSQENPSFPVDFTIDGSCQDVPALVGFVAGMKAYQFSKLSEQEQKDTIIKCLVKFFGREAANVVELLIKDWTKERYVGGCPVGIAAPGTYTMCDEENLRRPFGRIHWAGTETATLWRGYMDGAVQSGWRAASEILSDMKEDYLPPTVFTERDVLFKEEARRSSLFSSFRRKQTSA